MYDYAQRRQIIEIICTYDDVRKMLCNHIIIGSFSCVNSWMPYGNSEYHNPPLLRKISSSKFSYQTILNFFFPSRLPAPMLPPLLNG